MNPGPKGNQIKLIKSTEGIYLVDAGAGTGKTFTVSRRYAELLERGATPDEIFLATFTENAANNMREEIINHCDYNLADLRDAPISTFHGFCQQLLLREGFEAPEKLGIAERITGNTRTLSNQVLEAGEFSNFYDRFRDSNPEYGDFYRIVFDPVNLLGLIKSLAAKGIFPEREGWYREGKRQLFGDSEKYMEKLKEINRPRQGKRGEKQAKLLDKLNGMRDKTFASTEVRSKYDIKEGKQIRPEVMREAFREDRDGLFQFVHDLYLDYIEYALGRNYLNFSFQLMFAFVLLMENAQLRSKNQFDYVMIDEFQDTNEIQFKLSLLLSGKGNIAAVGDWKQSIFGFQYASVKNITEFRERLLRYHEELNSDTRRVPYKPGEVNEIKLMQNYRSSQKILDFSESSLRVRGRKKEEVELDQEVVSLEAAKDKTNTGIKAFAAEEEPDAVLSKLVEVVEGEEFRIDGGPIRYEDVAIFSRNRNFARALDKRARELEIPVAYEGGVEIFKTDPAIILLAWSRVLEEKNSRRGWSVILEEAGYNIAEVEYMLEEKDYPHEMLQFRKRLKDSYDISEIARIVFVRYGYDNPFADAIIEALQEAFDASYMNLGAVVNFIEANIERKETYEVDSARGDAATVQTIHAAKGLEYPVVFLANMNSQVFPGTNSGGDMIFYDDLIGLRQRKVFSKEDGFAYDNLKAYLASRVEGVDYDEERRLLYVAMTRAENYLFLFAEKDSEGRFFQDLDIEAKVLKPDIAENQPEVARPEKSKLNAAKPESTRPVKRAVTDVTSTAESSEGGRGPEFGTMIHRFAERLVREENVKPHFDGEGAEDKKNVYDFISSLGGELYPEQDVLVPREDGGKRVVYHGSIDLLHVSEGRVDVIDFKTDVDKSNETEYRKQLELYREAALSTYPDREVEAKIFYTKSGETVKV